MAEGDYGIQLPVTVKGTTLTASDSLKFTFKRETNGSVLLEKEYTNIAENTVQLQFSAQESAKFPVGMYVYALDWYQNGVFMCNIILSAKFKVVDKA